MKVAVTGADGYLGRPIVAALSADERVDEVVAIDARPPDVRIVRMRPVATLGPGAPRIARGRVFVTLADFDPLMQFTWIDDVVSAFAAAVHTPSASGAFNVGGAGPVTASKAARLMG